MKIEKSKKSLKVLCLNIANGMNDAQNGFSLYQRVDLITELLNNVRPDVVIFLEANRSTFDPEGNIVSWNTIAEKIEDSTNLTQKVCFRNSNDVTSLGISCFYNSRRIPYIRVKRIELYSKGFIKSIGMNIKLNFHRKSYRFMGVHLPTHPKKRMAALDNLLKYTRYNPMDFICGDFNIYKSDVGFDMIDKIEEKYDIITNDVLSYVSFPHSYSRYKFGCTKYQPITPELGALGSSIDLILKPKGSIKNIVGGIINPFNYEWVNQSNQDELFNQVVLNNTVENRLSDHFPLLVYV